MEKKQTAVEWLVEQLIPNAMRMFDATTCNAIDQAKQMEKEEILDAWTDGYSCGMYQEGLGIDYYNETYLGIIKEEE